MYKNFPQPAHSTPWQWSSWRSSASSSFPPLSPPPYLLPIRLLPAGFFFAFQRLLVKQIFLTCDKSESTFCRSQTRHAATSTCQGSGDLRPACFGQGSSLNMSDGQFRSQIVLCSRTGRPSDKTWRPRQLWAMRTPQNISSSGSTTSWHRIMKKKQVWPSWKGMGRKIKAMKNLDNFIVER